MSTMVDASLPAHQFALNETLEEFPSAEFDVLRMAANGTNRIMPFVWITGDDLDEIVDAIDADPSTEDVAVIAELEDEYLLRMAWVANIRIILFILVEEEAMIVDASGKNGAWRFKILFPERASVSATHDFCEEYGIELRFDRIYELSDSLRRGQYGLSEPQYETLLHAYEKGIYHIPRGVNLQELAAELDVSHQALSERLRRGHGTLISNTLRPDLESGSKL